MSHGNNKDVSSEYLRLALPLMSKHAIPVTPPSYSVWYSYVSGDNAALRDTIDELTESGRPIDEKTTRELHSKYLAQLDQAQLDQARAALDAIVEKLRETMNSASGEAGRYQESLESYGEQLTGEVSPDSLRQLVSALSEETRRVHESSNAVSDRLRESQREAETLRKELIKAKEEATTDALTGLANRKALQRAMDQLLQPDSASAEEAGHCLLIADIDRFKRINDSFGHLLGDKVIKFVGNAIKECTKGKDLVARFGGEEFVVLLPETHLKGALAVGESIRRAIESGRLVRSDTRESIGTVTISIGTARYRPGERSEALIERADAALYRAKEGGRNRVERESLPELATGTQG